MLNTYKNILNKTQQTILSAALILAAASAVNAILGFVKGRLLATHFGDSRELAIFYTADRIPDLIYSVLVVGALSTIFIPVFTSIYKKDKERAWQTASSIINITISFFIILAVIIFFLAPYIMKILSIGKFNENELSIGADLMRIMLLSQLILVVSSFITSVLQSFKYFLIPALAPIAYNLGLICGIVLLSDKIGIFGPAVGVAIGATLHLIIQLPALKNIKFDYIPFNFNFHKNGAAEIIKLMPSRIGSVLINNIISTVNNSLAILISASAVVHLKFANQLQFFPVNIFGFSIAHACLPTLSEEGCEDNYEKFKNTFVTSFHQMMFLVIPTSVILLILRVPIVRIVFGASEFPWEATIKTSYALAFFSLSIFAQSGIYLATRAFYALKDTDTPVKVGFLTLIINVLISLIFVNMFKFGVWSIALSFSITSIINFVSLMYLISGKIGGIELHKLIKPFTKIGFAALFMGGALYLPLKLLDQFVFDTTRTINLLLLTGIATFLGIVTYLFLTWIFKVEEIELLYRLAKKLKIKRDSPVVATSSIGQREEIED